MLALATAPLVLANPIDEPIGWILGSIGSYLQQTVSRGTVINPLGLLVPLGDPNVAVVQSPLATIVQSGGDFDRIAKSIKGVGYVLFAVLLVARMLKLAATGRLRSPAHLLFDLALKLVLGLVAIEGFDQALNLLGKVSMWGAFLLEDAILSPISKTASDILTAFPTQGLGGVLIPILYALVAYLVLLVVTSRLVLLLGALISPLGIPIALYNEHGRLAGTWTRMIVSGLLVPVLAGVGAAGSLAVAWLVHEIAGNGPYIGSYLGALTGECGLFVTAFATTAMFRDAVKQGLSGVRGSFEGAQMGPVARGAGDTLETARRGLETAAFVGMVAAAPEAAPAAAGSVRRGGSEPEGGGEGTAPAVPRLPGGPGGSDGGSQLLLPAAVEADGGSRRLVPAPSDPDLPLTDEFIARRHVDGGEVIYEFERRQLLHYTTFLSEPAGDAPAAPRLGPAQEA